jgi:hypothetical protein
MLPIQHFFLCAACCVGLIFASCGNQDICLSNQHAVQISLKSVYSAADKDTSLRVSAHAMGRTDSVYSSRLLSKLFLPLSFDREPDTSVFVVKFNTTIDTLYLIHRKQLDFVSGDCGYVFKFDIDELWFTKNTIDSAAIVYPIVKYGEDAINIKLFVY